MDRLDDLEAFLTIMETGSQSAAARQLGRSLQAINRSLLALEESLGVVLIQRTTRRSRPTEAGLAFHARVRPAYREIIEARRDVMARGREPSGLLRIAAPALFAPTFVAPAVCEFMRRHPRVEIDLHASDRPVKLLEDGFDLAVRIRELPDSTLKARRLGTLRTVVFGSPGYFAEHGRPRHPEDLLHHQCVVRITETGGESWPFRIDGRHKSLRMHGRFRTDSAATLAAAVAGGAGIGLAPFWQIRGLLDHKIVEIILEPFEAARLPIQAVMLPAMTPHDRVRLFADLLAARLKTEAL